MPSGCWAASAGYAGRSGWSRSSAGTRRPTAARFSSSFRGPVTDAQPVREFLEPQLRAASTRNLEAGFELTFADGLSMTGDAAETFTERLSRFAGGAAYVSATAHAAES